MPTHAAAPIVFYDGDCGLCDRAVRWVMARDRGGRFRFAPLQGETYRGLDVAEKPGDLQSMLVYAEGRLYRRGDAVLRVMRGLGGAWAVLAVIGGVVPRVVRDAGYAFVAARRRRWFGGPEACRLPSAADRARLLP